MGYLADYRATETSRETSEPGPDARVARQRARQYRDRPPVVLMVSTGVAGLGLLGLSFAATPTQTVITALVFAIGIAIVWPTMMGFVAERTPKTGALGLGLMAAAGSLAVGTPAKVIGPVRKS